MDHEFHSLADGPLSAKFHGKPVWKTTEPGIRFADVPNAPAVAATDVQRQVQIKQLAKEFFGVGKYRRDPNDIDLRLLPQPVYRYAALKQGVIAGGVFAFVQGTDPDILLLIEARGKDVAAARWQFAAARMHSVAVLRLWHQEKTVWESEPFSWSDVNEKHERVYTNFRFKQIPDFLKDAATKPKP